MGFPKWFRKASTAAQANGWQEIPETPRPAEDDFTRQRREIEQFSEDYLTVGKKVLHSAARFVGYILPFLAVVAVGSDLGAFYAPGLGAFSSYLLAYGIECAIAALTVMLGSAMGSNERSTSHNVRLAITGLAWLVLSSGSALSLYVMAISSMSHTITGALWYVVIAWRVASVACFDLASICILFWIGKSLAHHLDDLHKKMRAITEVNEAELAIARAQQAARMREQEDAAYLASRESHEAFTRKLQEMANNAILNSVNGSLSMTSVSEIGGQTDRLPLVGRSQMANSGTTKRQPSARKGPKVEEAESTQTKK